MSEEAQIVDDVLFLLGMIQREGNAPEVVARAAIEAVARFQAQHQASAAPLPLS